MLVRDSDTGEVWFEHQADLPRPIASITKLISAMVLLDLEPAWDRPVTLGEQHMLTPFGWKTPWAVGLTVTPAEMLQFALVASDNIAMTTAVEESGVPLGVFVERMNDKAAELGMVDSEFVDPTGLDDWNSSTAADVARLVEAAAEYPAITAACRRKAAEAHPPELPEAVVSGATNRVLWDPFWTVHAAKTGYTRLSGYCLAVVADAATGERMTMVFLGLDRDGKRFRMVERVGRVLQERAAGAADGSE